MGLACFQIFLMLVERDIMGFIYLFIFLVGVFFNKIFYIMTWMILDFNT